MMDSQENLPATENLEPEVPVTAPEQSVAGETSDVKPEVKLTRQEIVDQIKSLVQRPVDEVKDEIDSLKQSYYKLRKAEIEAARKQFEENKDVEDEVFTPEADELEEILKSLLNTFKEKKAAFAEEQERIKEVNLVRKKEILDEIKALTEDSDNINKRYNDFQQLQQSFKEITNIPASAVNDLWKSYQLYVERFYDLLKINKELRDYDFKKNLDQKIALCEAAEALSENEDIIGAFKSLQALHEEWKGIGPVAKELRDELWNRFKAASSVINKRHQQHFESLKEGEQKNEEAKTALCVEIESINTDDLKSFNAWDEKTKEIIALQEQWKTIGFASRKVNNQLFERFRKSCDEFFRKKAEYFKAVKDEMARNLEKKKALCEKAEALKESTEWKSTTDTLIAIQKEWKTIGPVAKKYSDAVWKRFISACDYFFEQKAKQTSSQRQVELENLNQKKEIIAKLNAIDENMETAEATARVRELMAEWNKIGFVPFKEKDKIYKEYQSVLDKHFTRLNMQENRNRLMSYTSTVQQLASSDQAQNKLYREREKLVHNYERLKAELHTYENNMGFLNISSKSGNSMLKEMERKMQQLKDQMQLIIQKIELIDENL
ncbi:DUF349 domain-containing protein [Coprobacter secundus]|jgi:hypothetical protein|uniref:DUF349 domain-containing protein n=1 Tax=Coprobacter secundus subsp. similis TaxID=2751153 RepID=A0A7G1I0M1_9BACT|nr:DUF349 domain-containing protein [Coprobacter secundus]KHM47926.1 hypothetical protein PU94_05135 [Coprobacter secundus]BCI64783.1 hypothetical protein Cop2CBH44_31360 [Coprobacter secundus subsp. similis]CCY35176.1 putative uncharacterized protein [Tannerella sp. CAG:118]